MGRATECWNTRVLLVDDDERMHGLFRRILKQPSCRWPLHNADVPDAIPPFQTSSAFRGAEAWEMVQSAVAMGKPYALVFMDMEMAPGWDGIETIERVRQVDPDVEIVICTGHWSERREQRLRAIDRGHEIVILSKPFHNGEVHQLASRLVRTWNGLQPSLTTAEAGPGTTRAVSTACS